MNSGPMSLVLAVAWAAVLSALILLAVQFAPMVSL